MCHIALRFDCGEEQITTQPFSRAEATGVSSVQSRCIPFHVVQSHTARLQQLGLRALGGQIRSQLIHQLDSSGADNKSFLQLLSPPPKGKGKSQAHR